MSRRRRGGNKTTRPQDGGDYHKDEKEINDENMRVDNVMTPTKG